MTCPRHMLPGVTPRTRPRRRGLRLGHLALAVALADTALLLSAPAAHALTVVAATPAPGQTDVPTTTDVEVVFDRSGLTGINSMTFMLRPDVGSQLVPATISGVANVRTLTPLAELQPSTTYQVVLLGGVICDVGTGECLPGQEWTFQTAAGDTVAPRLLTRSPAAGAAKVTRRANVRASFSEPVIGVNRRTFTLRRARGGAPVRATVTRGADTNRWVLNPRRRLRAGTRYIATVRGGADLVRDAAGNPLPTARWSFRTRR